MKALVALEKYVQESGLDHSLIGFIIVCLLVLYSIAPPSEWSTLPCSEGAITEELLLAADVTLLHPAERATFGRNDALTIPDWLSRNTTFSAMGSRPMCSLLAGKSGSG